MSSSSGPMVTVADTQSGSSRTATAAAPRGGERVPSPSQNAPYRTLAKCLELAQLEHRGVLPLHAAWKARKCSRPCAVWT